MADGRFGDLNQKIRGIFIMIKNKHLTIALCLIVLLSLCLTACSSNSTSQQPQQAEQAKESKIEPLSLL
jgi:ABC-type oligopeptide transport system substrate-binding subunit